MKKLFIFCFLCLLTSKLLFGQEQPKNIIGVSAGFTPSINGMYFGMPWDFYPNRELSPLCQFFYARQVLPSVRIGGYIELEKVKFSDQTGADIHSFRRNNIGLNCLWQYPKTALHMQLGGYLGYGYLRANNWTDLTGIDYGGIVGPAYEKGKYGIAAHLQSGYGGYKSSGTPKDVKLYSPKILLKFYRRF
jgi:hypothetical protein